MKPILILSILLLGSMQAQIWVMHPVWNDHPVLWEMRYYNRDWVQRRVTASHTPAAHQKGKEYREVTRLYNKSGMLIKTIERTTSKYDNEGRMIYHNNGYQSQTITYDLLTETAKYHNRKGKPMYTLVRKWNEKAILTSDEEWDGKRVVQTRYLVDDQNTVIGYERWRGDKLEEKVEYLTESDSIKLVRYTYKGVVYDVQYTYSRVKSNRENYWQQKDLLISTNGKHVCQVNQTEWDTYGLPKYIAYKINGEIVGTESIAYHDDGLMEHRYMDAKGKVLGTREELTGNICASSSLAFDYTANYKDKNGKPVKEIEQKMEQDCQQITTVSTYNRKEYKTIKYLNGAVVKKEEIYINGMLSSSTDYLVATIL